MDPPLNTINDIRLHNLDEMERQMYKRRGRSWRWSFPEPSLIMTGSTMLHCCSRCWLRSLRWRFVFSLVLVSSFIAASNHNFLWQKLILKVCRCYNVFCLGANQALYAILVGFVMEAFGRKVVLLHGAGTRMASYFYAIFWLLRLKNVLVLTVEL